jgi:outer membrane receptor protein involved in Fe transport
MNAAEALNRFAEQTGAIMLFPYDLASARQANAVSGRYTLLEGLDLLLQDTGLSGGLTDKRVVNISRDGNKQRLAGEGVMSVQKVPLRRKITAIVASMFSVSAASGQNTEVGTQPLEEIIVTAQKREQRAVDIPMSISVLSRSEIERQGIENMVDVSFATPGIMVQEFGPGRQVIYMRGVGNRVGDSPLTSVYLDEIPVTAGSAGPGTTGTLDLQTADLERIEVLRGPQGTLYGVGAVSGTIRFVTAKPDLNQFGGSASLSALFTDGGDPSQKASIVFNAPVVEDTFGLRIVATVQNNGGWIDRREGGKSNINNTRLKNARIKGLWQISDNFDLTGTVIVHRNSDSDGGGLSHSDPDGTWLHPIDPLWESPFRNDYDLYNLTGTYDSGWATFLSSTSYFTSDSLYEYSYIAGPETLYSGYERISENEAIREAFSQEIRLASQSDSPVIWTVGAFYQDATQEGASSVIAEFAGVLSESSSQGRGESTSWATFGDVTYGLTDKLEIGAGVRYFKEEKKASGVSSEQSGDFSKTTWRATASYSVLSNWKAYMSASTGFRSGGFSTEGFPPYDPETLLSYELGTKVQTEDGKASVDLALFYGDYQDYLRQGYQFNPNNNGFLVAISNLGNVSIKGVDLSVSANVMEGLIIHLNGSYIDSTIDSLSSEASGSSLGEVGDPVDYIPRFSYAVGAEYGFHWGRNIPGYFGVNYSYRDRVSVIDRSITVPVMQSDEIRLLSARAGAEWDRWSIEMFGENLLNETGSFDPWVFWSNAVRNRPRTYGVQLGFDFY